MREQGGLIPARRRGLADEVADQIREAIFAGVYPPGAQLREVELAAALEVSRGPVREALLRLEGEGLVRNEWHRGAIVVRLSARDAVELNSLRGALERLAVEQVVEHASQQDLDALEKIVEQVAPGLKMQFADRIVLGGTPDIGHAKCFRAIAGHCDCRRVRAGRRHSE